MPGNAADPEAHVPITRIAVMQPRSECRWSRPIPVSNLTPAGEPSERPWICVRTGHEKEIAEADCDCCPFWQPDEPPDR
jgi:hypothetical protein